MASKQFGKIEKIYSLKTIGFPDVDKTLTALRKKFDEVKVAKQALEKQSSKAESSKEIDDLNKKIQDQIKKEKELTLEIKKQVELRKRIKLGEEVRKSGALQTAVSIFQDNSIKQARESNKQLRAERDLLNTSTAEGAARIKELNDEIDKNNQLIKENVDNLSKQKINIGNYEGAAKIVVEALSNLEEKITSLKAKQGSFQDLTKVGGFMTSKQREEMENTNKELEAATKQYAALQKITSQPTFLNLAGQLGTARNQIGFLTSSLAELEIQGQKDTDQYRKLQTELARLTDVMQDTRAEIKALSSDTRSIDLVASGIGTLASITQTAAGASVLFGDSQEEVRKKILFLQEVENIATGIRAVSIDITTRGTAANKAYAFVQGLVAKALDTTAAAGTRAKAALGLLGITATVIGAVAIAYTLLKRRSDEAINSQKVLNETLKESANEYTNAVQLVNELRINIGLAKDGFINKKEVVRQYNDTIGKTTGEVKSLDQAEQALSKNADAYIKFTLLKAAAQLALAKAAKEALAQAERETANAEDLKKIGGSEQTEEAPVLTDQGGTIGFKTSDARQETELEKRIAKQRQLSNNAVDKFQGIAKNFQEQMAIIAKEFNFNLFGKPVEVNDLTKNAFDKIDALRDEQLAKENQRVLEIKKIRELTLDEEIQHVQNVERVNVSALKSKIKYLNEQKKKDAQDLKDLAEFRKDRVEVEVDTLEAIQKARDDFFKKRESELKDQLEKEIEAVRQNAQAIIDDPSKSSTEKAGAQLEANKRIIELQTRFNFDIDQLEKELNQKSFANALDRSAAIKKLEFDRLKLKKELSLAGLQDIKAQGEKEVSEEQIKFDLLRKKILDNLKLTSFQKGKLLEKLEAAEKRTILSKELENLQEELEFKKLLLDLSLISDLEYQKALEDVVKKKVELSKTISDEDVKAKEKLKKRFTDLKSFVQSGLRDLFKIDEGSELDGAIGEIMAQSFDLAKQAMNNFFDAERDRIQENLQLQFDRLEMEKEHVFARAQSTAEIASIEKQYAIKKRAEQQKANEQLKKSKRSEAKIAFLTELANIWSSVWQLGPIAGPIVGAIFSGLAIARYALTTSQINKETFEKGGAPTKKGGQAKGRSHAQGGIPFNYDYEAEGKELFIVNKKSAQDNKVRTITGTNKQIASLINQLGGGVAFDHGAKLTKFQRGGYLGDMLQAPIFPSPSTIINNSISKDDMSEIMESVKDELRNVADEQSKRIDRIQTTVSEKEITNSQKKSQKLNSINSI